MELLGPSIADYVRTNKCFGIGVAAHLFDQMVSAVYTLYTILLICGLSSV